jgi:hypothetical protein
MEIVMAKSKIALNMWAAARLRWETEPTCTYNDLAAILGISKQAIAKRARLDGWEKQLDMARIVALAHQKADRMSIASSAEKSESMAEDVRIVVQPEHQNSSQHFNLQNRNETDQLAMTAARAAILERHRSEWLAVRNLLYMAVKAKDFDLSRTAKNAVESMKKVQEGERLAWNLVDSDEQPALQIVIERTPGFRVVT